MGHFNNAARSAVLLLISSLLVAGCSSSSDSLEVSGNDEVINDIDSVATETQPDANDISSEVSDEVVVSANDPVEETSELEAPAPESVPDSLVQNRTQVDFDITVPAYQSDALQVQLIWGETNATASWVSDELWTVSLDLPTNTENTLSVTFSDNNGSIVLASFEQAYRTGSNAAEAFNIAVEQFSSEQWDADNDGTSNLDELIAGTDPLTADAPVSSTVLPLAPSIELELVPVKTFRISWQPTEGADFYRVLENPDGLSGFNQVSTDLESSVLSFDQIVSLHRQFDASYLVQACNAIGCTDSAPQLVSGTLEQAIGYFKSSNAEFEDRFGTTVSLSADGNTLAVAASGESGRTAPEGEADSVYVFQSNNGVWAQQAVLSSNAVDGNAAGFGSDISLSADGNTLAVGAGGSFRSQSAVYVFERTDGSWAQQAFLEASNPSSQDEFGLDVSLSGDGNTLAVGAPKESSSATGVNGDQDDNSASFSGAVYVFVRSDDNWQQQVYLKASNTDEQDRFGWAVSINGNGNTLAVSAWLEESAATGVNGDQSDNSAGLSGAVYVFERTSGLWEQQAYLKSSNGVSLFANTLSLSANGNTLVVGGVSDDSTATGVNGDQNDSSAQSSGAVFVFERSDANWEQQAYLKASNTDPGDSFGNSVSLSADGTTLAVAAPRESSAATGINGDQGNTVIANAGAVYVFQRSDGSWLQQAYVKASNTEGGEFFNDTFGGSSNFNADGSLSLSADGSTLAVGATGEASAATGVDGDQSDNSLQGTGAVYLY